MAMNRLRWFCWVLFVLMLVLGQEALARGGHGGAMHGGGHGGGRGGFGVFWGGSPFWGSPFWPYYGWPYPYYYSPPIAVPVPTEPPTYI